MGGRKLIEFKCGHTVCLWARPHLALFGERPQKRGGQCKIARVEEEDEVGRGTVVVNSRCQIRGRREEGRKKVVG